MESFIPHNTEQTCLFLIGARMSVEFEQLERRFRGCGVCRQAGTDGWLETPEFVGYLRFDYAPLGSHQYLNLVATRRKIESFDVDWNQYSTKGEVEHVRYG